ncbi:hypothetical protein HZA57_01250 [Candidatus Poribacteria bacterium]|nr:hypothetical protein [Candidatus Poribacteria bacterium]
MKSSQIVSRAADRLAGGLVVFVALVALMLPGTAPASLVVPLSIEEMTAISETIVRAEVETAAAEVYHGKILTRSTLRVTESFKGPHAKGSEFDVVTLGGTLGKLGSVSPGMPVLKKGDDAVLFLNKPAAERDGWRAGEMNADSPLAKSPQIVGGFQGKFDIVEHEVPAPPNTGQHTVATSRVSRPTPGKAMPIAATPAYETFASQLRKLTSPERAQATTTHEISTVGKIEVPVEQSEARALRFFDPLPAMAQMTPAQIQRALDDHRAEQERSKAAREAAAAQTRADEAGGGASAAEQSSTH